MPAATHGLSRNPLYKAEYDIWKQMRARCNNPRHKEYGRYGGRGISVCARWDDFYLFYTDMGPRPSDLYSIDRKDNDGNYDPFNCRWATPSEQNYNKKNEGPLPVKTMKALPELRKLFDAGISTRKAASIVGISKSMAHRIKQSIEAGKYG